MRFLFILLLLMMSEPTWSVGTQKKACDTSKNVNMSDDFGPMYDQGMRGWCYAGVYADMNNWARFHDNPALSRSDPANRVSLDAAALLYNRLQPHSAEEFQAIILNRQSGTNSMETWSRLSYQHDLVYNNLNIVRESLIAKNPHIKELSDQFDKALDQVNVIDKQLKDSKISSDDALKMQKTRDALMTKGLDALDQRESECMKNPEYKAASTQLDWLDSELRKRYYTSLKDEPESGFTNLLFDMTKGRKLCSENEVHHQSVEPYLKALYSYYENPGFTTLCQAEQVQKSVFHPSIGLTKSLTYNQDVLLNYSKEETITRILKDLCRGIPATNYTTESVSLLSIESNIHSRQPIFVEYDTGFVFPKKDIPADASHISTLVGTFHNCEDGTDNFIVRNAWGPKACLSQQEKFKKANETPTFSCDQDGNFIVPEKLMFSKIERAFRLKKQEPDNSTR